MNADTKAVARELVAWFTSGNSIPVDMRHVVKVSGDKIMKDVEALKKSLEDGSV